MCRPANRTGYAICIILLMTALQCSAATLGDEVVKKCLAANNISREEYGAILNPSTSEEDSEDSVPQKYKCYIRCLAREINILDEHDHVDVKLVDKLKDFNEKNRAAIYDCKRQYDELDDSCEYAYQMMLCAIKNIDPKDEH